MRYVASILFVMISFFANAQRDSTLITLSLSNVSFAVLVQNIEEQTQVQILYKPSDIKDSTFTVNARNESALKVLKSVLNSDDYDIKLWNGYIVILYQEELFSSLPDFNAVKIEEVVPEKESNSSYIQGRKADFINIKIGNAKRRIAGKLVNVKGSIINAATNEPVENATVYISTINKGAITDQNGIFNMQLKEGKYPTQIECLGMKKINCQLEVLSEGSFQIEMESAKFEIQEVQVYGDQQMNFRKKEAGLEKLNVETIKELPNLLGESDIIKVTEMLPGVVSVGEGAAGLNVRGGSFDQNAFYFNKIAVYNTSHLFGFFPAFNAYVVNDFSLYKGFVPAKYGGRLSSVFDINARSGNKKNYTASGGIGLSTANITVEGPIKKDTASFLVNYRTSYSDWILRQINDYNIQNSEARFNDLTVSLDYDLPNTQINVFGYYSYDYFKFSDLNNYWYTNGGLSASVGHHFTPTFRADFSISASQYEFKTIDTQVLTLAYEHPFKLQQYDFNADFSKEFSRKNSLSFGASSSWINLNRGKVTPYGEQSNRLPVDLGNEQGLEMAVYVSDDYEITPLLNVTAGFRLSMYSAFGPKNVYTFYENGPKEPETIQDSILFQSGEAIKWYTFPEFRISANYQTDENGNIKLAFNQMHQSIFMLNQTISLSPNTQWKLADYYLKPSQANQYSIGVFRTIPKGKWEISLDFFYKDAKDFSAFKDGVNFLSNPLVETTVLQGDLTSYGAEFLIKKSWPKIDIWLAYTFSRSIVTIKGENDFDNINNGEPFPSDFDIPNVLNALFVYRISKRVTFSTTITYQTGKPATFPTSFYYIDGVPRIDYSNRNEFRIPDYFRTDISLTIQGNLKKEKFLHSKFNFSVYNLTGRDNPYSVFFEQQDGRIFGYQYSVIGVPVVMVTWMFKLGNYDSN